MIQFAVEAVDGAARAGVMETPRGTVQTPMFMPVGTQGTVKAMTPEELLGLGAQIVLANTYHLHLRPGEEVVQRLGGLHRFMHWERPILTDSGGYQVMSLAKLSRVSEQGVRFQSHLDGAELMLTPEGAVGIQEALGSDVMMCLDHLVALPAEPAALRAACELTTRWAERCKAVRRGEGALFAIVQGGVLPALRSAHAQALVGLGFDGYAIGGLAVGEERAAMYDTVAHTAPLLPAAQPRYLMGAGEPADLLQAIGAGVDLFDCVAPTRNARNGTLYTRRGRVNIKQARYREDPAPLEADCPCPACRHYSRAYLSHLYRAREILSMRLNTWHNLTFYLGLVREARAAILAGHYAAWARDFLAAYAAGNADAE
jgi:queuine tRNA-ribosyltransferase